MNPVNVGDSSAWHLVPLDALVLSHGALVVKRAEPQRPWESSRPCGADDVLVVCLDVPREADGADLRRLLDIFETTRRLYQGAGHGLAFEDLLVQALGGDSGPLSEYDTNALPVHAASRRSLAVRLYEAGWHGIGYGMGPEDAARMLSTPRRVTFADLRAIWNDEMSKWPGLVYLPRSAWRSAVVRYLCFNPYPPNSPQHGRSE